MLLACRKCQHKATCAIGIDRLTSQAPGHLADIFVLGSKQADVRTAEIQAIANRLAFTSHNISAHCPRRRYETKSNRFGKDRDQQRALGLHRFGELGEIGQRAKHIRALNHDTGGILIYRCQNGCLVIDRNRQTSNLETRMLGQGPGGAAIMGMQAAREDHFGALSDAGRHHDRFCTSGGAIIHRRIGHITSQ